MAKKLSEMLKEKVESIHAYNDVRKDLSLFK